MLPLLASGGRAGDCSGHPWRRPPASEEAQVKISLSHLPTDRGGVQRTRAAADSVWGRDTQLCVSPEAIVKPEAWGHLPASAAAGVVGMPLNPVYLKSCYQALGTPSLELAARGC